MTDKSAPQTPDTAPDPVPAGSGRLAERVALGLAGVTAVAAGGAAVATGGAALPVLAAVPAVLAVPAALAAGRARRRSARAADARRAAESSLRRTATAVAAGGDPAQVLSGVAREALAAIGADGAAVVRYLPGGTSEVVGAAGARGVVPGRGGHVSLRGAGAVAEVHRRGAPVVLADGATPLGEGDGGVGRSAVAVPVAADGAVWGAIYGLSVAADRFGEAEAATLARYAHLVGIAVANATLRARWEAQATVDPQTGLPNARAFRERLDAETERARRHGRELALVLVDLDGTDDVAHAAGRAARERVLNDLARTLSGRARSSDTVARTGDHEFAWLMPECDAWSAWKAVDALRMALANTRLGGLPGNTISAGVCDLAAAEGRADRLLECASGALYWAREHGRDLCVRFSPDVVVDLSVEDRTERLERARARDAVRLLAQAVDGRSPDRHGHSERVAAVAAALAREMGWAPAAADELHAAGLVHDVGAVGIPETLLATPGPLPPAGIERVRAHAALGGQMVSDVLDPDATAWVRGHHERWDGGGYPDGLAGEAIPEGARILAVAEAFDAIASDRPHRPARGRDEAVAEIAACAGTQFAPDVAEALGRMAASGRLAEVLDGVAPGG